MPTNTRCGILELGITLFCIGTAIFCAGAVGTALGTAVLCVGAIGDDNDDDDYDDARADDDER